MTRPRFDVILTIEKKIISNVWLNSLAKFTKHLHDLLTTSKREFFEMRVENFKSKASNRFEVKKLQIISINLFCRHCNPYSSFQPVRIGLPGSYTSLNAQVRNINKLNKDNIVYKIWPTGPSLIPGLQLYWNKLPDTSRRSNLLKLLNDRGKHLTDIQWEMEARLLRNVF